MSGLIAHLKAARASRPTGTPPDHETSSAAKMNLGSLLNANTAPVAPPAAGSLFSANTAPLAPPAGGRSRTSRDSPVDPLNKRKPWDANQWRMTMPSPSTGDTCNSIPTPTDPSHPVPHWKNPDYSSSGQPDHFLPTPKSPSPHQLALLPPPHMGFTGTNLPSYPHHRPSDSQSTASSSSSSSDAEGWHTRFTSFSSCASHPAPAEPLPPYSATTAKMSETTVVMPETAAEMSDAHGHETRQLAGPMDAYVPGPRDKFALSDYNEWLMNSKHMTFDERFNARLVELEDMRAAALDDLRNKRITCAIAPHMERVDRIPDCLKDNDGTGKAHVRKAVSHLMGRNKNCTRRIEEYVWVTCCRKHYQRVKYRTDRLWARAQAEFFELTLYKVQLWSDLNAANRDADGQAAGPVVVHWTLHERARARGGSNDEAVPVDGWLKDLVDQGRTYTTAEVIRIVFRMRHEMFSELRGKYPDLEVLPTFEDDKVKAPVKRRPKGHFHSKSVHSPTASKRATPYTRRNHSMSGLSQMRGAGSDSDGFQKDPARGFQSSRIQEQHPFPERLPALDGPMAQRPAPSAQPWDPSSRSAQPDQLYRYPIFGAGLPTGRVSQEQMYQSSHSTSRDASTGGMSREQTYQSAYGTGRDAYTPAHQPSSYPQTALTQPDQAFRPAHYDSAPPTARGAPSQQTYDSGQHTYPLSSNQPTSYLPPPAPAQPSQGYLPQFDFGSTIRRVSQDQSSQLWNRDSQMQEPYRGSASNAAQAPHHRYDDIGPERQQRY